MIFISACSSESIPTKENSLATICPNQEVLFFPGRCPAGIACNSKMLENSKIKTTSMPPDSWWPDKTIFRSNSSICPIKNVAGYSAGRVPLIRRMHFLPNYIDKAILIDPSYEDGRSDFKLNKNQLVRGVDIVAEWLNADKSRKFYFVYINSRGNGHESYVDKQNYPQKVLTNSQVILCKRKTMSDVGHLEFANALGPDFLLNPGSNNLVECDALE